jgi:glycoside/pentoside/hexuronide:cation symporter, GPH family
LKGFFMASIAIEKPKRGGLSLKNKLAFGAGDLGAAINASVSGFYLLAFLLDVAKLDPESVSLIFFIAQFWDAVNDPLIGTLSDKTRSRFGRRRSWMLFGALPFGLAFALHWLVPFPPESPFLFWYYLVIAILLRTASTAVNVPYTALTPEMTEDYNERTQLNSFRFSFSILGGLLAFALHPVLVGMFGSYFITASFLAIFIVLSSLVCVAGTFELPHKDEAHNPNAVKESYLKNLATVFQNRPFVIVTGIYLLSWLTLQFVQQFLQLYTRYFLNAEDQLIVFVGVLQMTSLLFLGVWTWVSARIGKKQTYIIGAVIWIFAMLGLFFIQPDQLWLVQVVAFFAGIGVSTAYLIPWSMLPDVVDYDELQTGERREGLYYGFFALLQQVGISVGVALGSLALGAAGYGEATGSVTDICRMVVNMEVCQPESILFPLRVIVSLAPVAMLTLSIPLALIYPISRQRHEEIMKQLEKNRAAATNDMASA